MKKLALISALLTATFVLPGCVAGGGYVYSDSYPIVLYDEPYYEPYYAPRPLYRVSPGYRYNRHHHHRWHHRGPYRHGWYRPRG